MVIKIIHTASLLTVMLIYLSCGREPGHPGYDYMPDMAYSRAYEAYAENPNYRDSFVAGLPPEGAVPYDYFPYPYANTKEGYEQAGRELKNPLSCDDKTILEGKKLYGLYCVYCHGDSGNGNGLFVQRKKFPRPPSLTTGKLRDLPEGKMYHSITYGKNLMGSHAVQLHREERWRVICFIKSLCEQAQP